MPLILSGIDGAGGGLPDGYEHKVDSATGSLQLWKGAELIATQNTDGSWFKTAVSTGVGSLHLGGGDSSDPAHSISSAGQNVVFKNEAFASNPSMQVVWFPAGWQGLSPELSSVVPATLLRFGVLESARAANGATSGAGGVDYDFTTRMDTNLCISAVTVRTHETIVNQVITNVITTDIGIEVHRSSRVVTCMAGNTFTIEYPSLYFARSGDELRLQMLKSNGQPLKVRAGTVRTNEPWRTLRARYFFDSPIATNVIGDVKDCYLLNDHFGWVKLDGRAVSSLTPTQQDSCAQLYITGNLPDSRNRFRVGAGGLYNNQTTGGSNTIAQSALPNASLSFNVTSGNESVGHTHTIDPPNTTTSVESAGHTHAAGSLSATTAGSAHSHSFTPAVTFRGDAFTNTNGGDGDGSSVSSTNTDGAHTHSITGSTGDRSANHTHNVDIAAFTSSDRSANHTHNVSGNTSSMNGGVTQTAHVPSYLAINMFIYLGM